MRLRALCLAPALAACATLPLTELDELLRSTDTRTVVFGDKLSIYSPYDSGRTHQFVAPLEAQRAQVFELFGVASPLPLIFFLRIDPQLGVQTSAAGGDRMRIDGISTSTHDRILGTADGRLLTLRVARVDEIQLEDGRTITGSFGVEMYTNTIRHEITHAALTLLGVKDRDWLGEGLAHAVEWIPIEDGHFLSVPPRAQLLAAARLESRPLTELLEWKQSYPVAESDPPMRLLALALVTFLVERQSAPTFRERALCVAGLGDQEILALEAEWSTWLDGIARAEEPASG
jgi:hypothetical protein